MLGAWLSDAGSLGAMIAFLVGGLIMLPVALCYAEVAGMYPVSGGEVAYIYEMYGERLAFVAGWLLAFIYVATTSFEAISVGWVLSAMFPGIEGPTVERDLLLSYDLPLAGAVETAVGSRLIKQLVLFAGLCGLITSWNAVLYAASRVVFSLGRAHMLPHGFARVHPRFGSPSNAVLFIGLIGALGSLMGREAILLIAGASSLVFSILFVLIIWGVILLRKRLPDHPRPYAFPGRMAGLGVALLLALGVLLLASLQPLLSSGGAIPPEWILIGGWLLLGLLFYFLAAPLRSQVSKDEQRWLILNEGEPFQRSLNR